MILTDKDTALMEPADFAELPEYSASIPTGVEVGKRWKRARNTYNGDDGWLMGAFEEHPSGDPELVLVLFRDLEIVR